MSEKAAPYGLSSKKQPANHEKREQDERADQPSSQPAAPAISPASAADTPGGLAENLQELDIKSADALNLRFKLFQSSPATPGTPDEPPPDALTLDDPTRPSRPTAPTSTSFSSNTPPEIHLEPHEPAPVRAANDTTTRTSSEGKFSILDYFARGTPQVDWFDVRTEYDTLDNLVKAVGLSDGFNQRKEQLEQLTEQKLDDSRKMAAKMFREESKSERAGVLSENIFLACLGSGGNPRSPDRQWTDLKSQHVEREDGHEMDQRRGGALEMKGAKRTDRGAATWSSVLTLVELTATNYTLNSGKKLQSDAYQGVMDAATLLNVQPFRHLVVVLTFSLHNCYLFILDRVRLRIAPIEEWDKGGFTNVCSLVQTLEKAPEASLGLPPFFSYTADGALSTSLSSSSKVTLMIGDPASSTSFIELPAKIDVELVSPKPSSVPFTRGTWVGGGKAYGDDSTVGTFVKITNTAVKDARHEPRMLVLANEKLDKRIVGRQIPRLVATFFEDTTSRPTWKSLTTPALPEGATDRAVEIIIMETLRDLKTLDKLDTPKLFWTAILGTLELVEALIEAGILHRDLSPGNCLATTSGIAVLIDLDCATTLTSDSVPGGQQASMDGLTGTRTTMAADVLFAMAEGDLKFHHRPRHDIISLYNLVWYTVTTKILEVPYKELIESAFNTPLPFVSSHKASTSAAAGTKSESVHPGWRSTLTATDVLLRLGWHESNACVASEKRRALWSKGTSDLFVKGLKNRQVAKVLRKLRDCTALSGLDQLVQEDEGEEVEDEEDEVEEVEGGNVEQERSDPRDSSAKLRQGIEAFKEILREAVQLFTTATTFDFPFPAQAYAVINKYPNPLAPHVISVDVLDRKVLDDGTVRSERLIGVQQDSPRWVRRLLGSQDITYVREVTFLVPSSITPPNLTTTPSPDQTLLEPPKLLMASTNLTLSSLLQCRESIAYLPHPWPYSPITSSTLAPQEPDSPPAPGSAPPSTPAHPLSHPSMPPTTLFTQSALFFSTGIFAAAPYPPTGISPLSPIAPLSLPRAQTAPQRAAGGKVERWSRDRFEMNAAEKTTQAVPVIEIGRMSTMSTTFVFFEIWVLVLSLSGVLYESVPHVVAALVAHVLAFIYAAFQLHQTMSFHTEFHKSVVGSACSGTGLIPQFWDEVGKLEIAILVLETVGMLFMAAVLRWSTFRKLGADPKVARTHALALVFEVFLQLSAFFIIAFQAIWLHELCDYPWTPQQRASGLLSDGYKIFLGILTGLIPAWLMSGYLGMHKKSRVLIIFLAGDVCVLAHSLFLATQKTYMATQDSFRFLCFLGAVASIVGGCTFLAGVTALLNLKRADQPLNWITAFPTDEKEVDLERGPDAYPDADDSTEVLADRSNPAATYIDLSRSTSLTSLSTTTTSSTSLSQRSRKPPPSPIIIPPPPKLPVIAISDSDPNSSSNADVARPRDSGGTFGRGVDRERRQDRSDESDDGDGERSLDRRVVGGGSLVPSTTKQFRWEVNSFVTPPPAEKDEAIDLDRDEP
ncbi:PRELI/MSF1 domain protein [Pseudohyphozyma bogoriensis]|nr:PRELI/MSF1 domain protein [Pseudohyphozyma bogoriensis]